MVMEKLIKSYTPLSLLPEKQYLCPTLSKCKTKMGEVGEKTPFNYYYNSPT
jgi:hypothetical protein